MGSSVQGLCLVAGRERRLKKEATDHVVGGANDSFGLTILGSKGTRGATGYYARERMSERRCC
jgi:hypothetical protein